MYASLRIIPTSPRSARRVTQSNTDTKTKTKSIRGGRVVTHETAGYGSRFERRRRKVEERHIRFR